MNVETITDPTHYDEQGEDCSEGVLARVFYHDLPTDGLQFLTDPGRDSLQVAVMHHGAGFQVQPHVHPKVKRQTTGTGDLLFVLRGRVKVSIYNSRQVLVATRVLRAGDMILQVAGGHGFEWLEQSECLEVKNGPYLGPDDKVRFSPQGS